jgi:hypothetical protein
MNMGGIRPIIIRRFFNDLFYSYTGKQAPVYCSLDIHSLRCINFIKKTMRLSTPYWDDVVDSDNDGYGDAINKNVLTLLKIPLPDYSYFVSTTGTADTILTNDSQETLCDYNSLLRIECLVAYLNFKFPSLDSVNLGIPAQTYNPNPPNNDPNNNPNRLSLDSQGVDNFFNRPANYFFTEELNIEGLNYDRVNLTWDAIVEVVERNIEEGEEREREGGKSRRRIKMSKRNKPIKIYTKNKNNKKTKTRKLKGKKRTRKLKGKKRTLKKRRNKTNKRHK